MDVVFYVLIGVAGGVLAGMGMGGGTLLIPMLTIFMGVNQHFSQAINLIAFIPMAIFVLFIHKKNNLLNFKLALPIILTGVLGSSLGALLAKNTEGDSLKVYFGIFLLCLGVFQIFNLILNKNLKKSLI